MMNKQQFVVEVRRVAHCEPSRVQWESMWSIYQTGVTIEQAVQSILSRDPVEKDCRIDKERAKQSLPLEAIGAFGALMAERFAVKSQPTNFKRKRNATT